jgi:hypothetical protein
MKEVMYGRDAPGGTEERSFRSQLVQDIDPPEKTPERQEQMRPQQTEKNIFSKGWKNFAPDFPKVGKVR